MNATVLISFEVYYRADEYVSIVSEYALFRRGQKIRKKSKPVPASVRLPWDQKLAIRFLAPLVLRYKMRKLGTCTFRIDEDQIQRTSKQGTLTIPWHDVVAIHRFSRAYLIEKHRGAVPLPYRCLDAAKAAALDELVRSKEAELELVSA